MSIPGKKLKVVTLLENNPYPFDSRCHPHMEALAGEGYQITVIAPRDNGQSWGETINGVRVVRFPALTPGKNAVTYVLEFFWSTLALTVLTLWVWMRHGLDVLNISNPPESLFVAGLIPKLAGKKVVFDLRDVSPELYLTKFSHANGLLYSVLIWLERMMCRISDRIIVVNESYRKLVIDRDHVKPERVAIVRQGPDIDQIRLISPDPSLRSRAPTIIAFLGLMAAQDGIDHLLGALHELDQRLGLKNWVCALIGPVEDQASLEALAAEYGISDRIWFAGFLKMDQWLPLLSAADICVEPCPASPLNNISTMNKIMDYMALCKPTVAYDLPEHRFTAGEAALYAKPNDQVDFACQIARLIEDVPLRSQLGLIGRQRMEQTFAWPYQKKNLLSVYNDLSLKKEKALAK